MTNEEALKYLDEHCTARVIPLEVKIQCSKALEKQIAKSVLNQSYRSGICPNCGSYVAFAWHEKACGDCGQTLDWSDDE